jgi:hypothetical protein
MSNFVDSMEKTHDISEEGYDVEVENPDCPFGDVDEVQVKKC